MSTLSMSQLVALARDTGFPDPALAAAVAMAESGGRTDADNPVSSATGLWQIMQSVHVRAHPSWSVAWLENPQNNARAAFTVSSGGRNWKPWVAYTSGAYLRFLPTARRATDGSTGSVSGSAAGSGGSSFDPSVWLRIAMGIVGGLLVLVALLAFVAPRALRALPAGKVLRKVL